MIKKLKEKIKCRQKLITIIKYSEITHFKQLLTD